MTVLAMAFGAVFGAFVALVSWVFISVPILWALVIYLCITLGFAILVVAAHLLRPSPIIAPHPRDLIILRSG